MNGIRVARWFLAEFNVRKRSPMLVCFAVWLIASPLTVSALSLGQIDDFQDGTTQGWGVGAGAQPSNIPSNGPAGTADRYLQYTSNGGSGTDGKLIIFNQSQWQGNYTNAGITGISLELKNLGSTTLSMRLAFFVNRTNGFSATTPFSLLADGNWHQAFFALTSANFTPIGSPGTFDSLLGNFTGQLRILDSASPALEGDLIAATIGVDDIQAVPEPSTFTLVSVSLLALMGYGLSTRPQHHPLHLPSSVLHCSGESSNPLVKQGKSKGDEPTLWERLGGRNSRVEPRLSDCFFAAASEGSSQVVGLEAGRISPAMSA
jgi:hypothetical protein